MHVDREYQESANYDCIGSVMSTCYICYGSGVIEEFDEDGISEKQTCECREYEDD